VTRGNVVSCYDALAAFLDSKMTIVYFDNMSDMTESYRHLRIKVREAGPTSAVRACQIVKYFADLSPRTKAIFMSKFKQGTIRIMLSTDAAGMGCDIHDILRVVQFRFPSSISVVQLVTQVSRALAS
ncbi:hypothetical protein BGW42_007198, partial [Actinomortierella wolfii]